MVLLRVDHERHPTEITERLVATVEDALRDMKEHRLLILASQFAGIFRRPEP